MFSATRGEIMSCIGRVVATLLLAGAVAGAAAFAHQLGTEATPAPIRIAGMPAPRLSAPIAVVVAPAPPLALPSAALRPIRLFPASQPVRAAVAGVVHSLRTPVGRTRSIPDAPVIAPPAPAPQPAPPAPAAPAPTAPAVVPVAAPAPAPVLSAPAPAARALTVTTATAPVTGGDHGRSRGHDEGRHHDQGNGGENAPAQLVLASVPPPAEPAAPAPDGSPPAPQALTTPAPDDPAQVDGGGDHGHRGHDHGDGGGRGGGGDH
jgi:hypothetical protein